MTNLDQRIAAHIKASPLLQHQKEVVAACVDAWQARFAEERPSILAVETPWFLRLDAKTLVVGMIDRVTMEDNVPVGNEWKTKGQPQFKADGTPYEGQTEGDWAKELANGHQCRIYALALQRGSFVSGVTQFNAKEPRIRVRAVNKPEAASEKRGKKVARDASVWTAPDDLPFRYSDEMCEQTAQVLIAKAAGLRAMRRALPQGPWAIPWHHCTNKFRRLCEYHAPYCSVGRPPAGSYRFDPADPGSAAIAASGVDTNDPELIILSASSFEKAQQCDEAYRILCTDSVVKEESEALAIGGLWHECVAMIGESIMEKQ